MHVDVNGWPCVGTYIGLLDDNNNNPIFKSEDELKLHTMQQYHYSLLINSLPQNLGNQLANIYSYSQYNFGNALMNSLGGQCENQQPIQHLKTIHGKSF